MQTLKKIEIQTFVTIAINLTSLKKKKNTQNLLIYFFFFLTTSGPNCGTWDLPLWFTDSLAVAHGIRCSTICGILVLQSGIKSTSPVLQGGFLTTGAPGKSLDLFI